MFGFSSLNTWIIRIVKYKPGIKVSAPRTHHIIPTNGWIDVTCLINPRIISTAPIIKRNAASTIYLTGIT